MANWDVERDRKLVDIFSTVSHAGVKSPFERFEFCPTVGGMSRLIMVNWSAKFAPSEIHSELSTRNSGAAFSAVGLGVFNIRSHYSVAKNLSRTCSFAGHYSIGTAL